MAIVNDRADIAAAVGADGVHVGQEDLSVKDARAIVGTRMLIGVSTHNIEQARAAVLDGANYLGRGADVCVADERVSTISPGWIICAKCRARFGCRRLRLAGLRRRICRV